MERIGATARSNPRSATTCPRCGGGPPTGPRRAGTRSPTSTSTPRSCTAEIRIPWGAAQRHGPQRRASSSDGGARPYHRHDPDRRFVFDVAAVRVGRERARRRAPAKGCETRPRLTPGRRGRRRATGCASSPSTMIAEEGLRPAGTARPLSLGTRGRGDLRPRTNTRALPAADPRGDPRSCGSIVKQRLSGCRGWPDELARERLGPSPSRPAGTRSRPPGTNTR
jgi:hypothetical protein